MDEKEKIPNEIPNNLPDEMEKEFSNGLGDDEEEWVIQV